MAHGLHTRRLLQFVGVMQNIFKDMCWFFIVWGVLILAFSTAMLGALHYPPSLAQATAGPADSCDAGAGANLNVENAGEPMKRWSLWWIVRTYLQSLGQARCLARCRR